MIPPFAVEVPVSRLAADGATFTPICVLHAAVGPGPTGNTSDEGRLGWTDQLTLYSFDAPDVRRHDQVTVHDAPWRVVSVARWVNPFNDFGSDRLEIVVERTTKE